MFNLRNTVVPILILFLITPLWGIDTLHCIAHFNNTPPMMTGSQMTPVVLGDINADGFDDWAFKYRDSNLLIPNDSVYIYMGSDSIDFTVDYKIRTRELGNIGDVNGDGFDDIAYIPLNYNMNQNIIDDPVIYILYGGIDFDLSPDDSCHLTNCTGLYKIQFDDIKKIGDINGDGYDDICYGPREYSGALITGPKRAYDDVIRHSLFLGGEDLSWEPDTVIIPPIYLLDSNALAYDWRNCTGLGDINADGFNDFSMHYFEISVGERGVNLHDSVTYVYYGSNDIFQIINSVDTFFIGDIKGSLGKISDDYSEAFFCNNKDTLNQIPGINIVSGNDINGFVQHYNTDDIVNLSQGDINADGYNDWIIWDKSESKIKGYFGGSSADNIYDFITPNEFVFNDQIGFSSYGEASKFYILGDICGDGYDKILFTEKIDDEYYDIYCYSYNEVKTIIKGQTPQIFTLSQNFPNPLNPTTTISYKLPEAQNIKLQVFDISGCLVETLYNGYKKAGHWEVTWNAGNYSSGIYLYQMKVGNFVDTKKMIVLK